jgi:hypothetical protein
MGQDYARGAILLRNQYQIMLLFLYTTKMTIKMTIVTDFNDIGLL